MKTRQTLRVHNAMVTDQMRSKPNWLRTEKKLGRKPRLEHREDRNALALHYIETGEIERFSARHTIIADEAEAGNGSGSSPRVKMGMGSAALPDG